ncbi:hypothetical protein B0H10DRAFT_2161680 [Mycena sp. CBHHK59/15]|nr:hypothetical protein B0H10DRAFT_2161680 [Mycena sp. CBHHK59/15]
MSVSASAKWSRVAIKHLNTILIFTLGIYFYCDVFPLATSTLTPIDILEGRTLWVKIITLFVVSGIIPLIIPQQYIPVDPKNKLHQSYHSCCILEPIIFLAYRVPHLKFNQLPPLSDYDYVENLKTKAFPCMDVSAGKTRHIFFGIIWVFSEPLISYLENPDAELSMKPWVWIALLFFGPMVWSLSFQWYIFVSRHIMAQSTVIITQLVFEHALCIRVKAKTGDKGKANDATAKAPTKEAGTNLLGKITNLITTDLSNINEAAFVGMGYIFFFMVALFPLPGYVAELEQTVQKQTLKKTDARVQTVTETMNVLWMEPQMNKKIAEKHEQELNWIWRRKLLELANGTLTYGLLLVYIFTVILKEELSASKVFSSMAVFNLLRGQMWFAFYCISTAVNDKTKLLDPFLLKDTVVVEPEVPAPNVIGFHDATFAWSQEETDGTLMPLSRRFQLKIEDELYFKPGCVNLVVRPTGLMHFVPSSPSSFFNLPQEKGVMYAAQESCVLNDTFKNNILFNEPMDTKWYKKILYQCCLEHDLELFNAEDETEVSEKGLTLSGGQKAWVMLTRAIYVDAQIILLDNVLMALDVHTVKWIVDTKCLCGDLIQDRMISCPIANFVVSMGSDERVHSQGSISEALAKDEEDEEILKTAKKEIDSPPAAGEPKKTNRKLIIAEEIALGHVSWSALNLYFSAYSVHVSARYQLSFLYHFILAALLLLRMVIYACSFILYTLGLFQASRSLHKQLVTSVLGTTLRWLDVTPVSHVIAHCTMDIGAVVGSISSGFCELLDMSIAMLIKFSTVVLFTPEFFFVGVFVGIIGAWCSQVYIASQLSIKREMSNAKAPVLAQDDVLMNISIGKINRLTSPFCGAVSVLKCSQATSLAYYVVCFQSLHPFNISFSLNIVLGFSNLILHWVRMLNQFEVQGNSLERIQCYVRIEQEPKLIVAGMPPAYWPTSRSLSANKLSTSLTLSLLRCIFTDGMVHYNGIPTSTLNLDTLWKNITIIPQVPELLAGSLRSNLNLFGQYDDAMLNTALRSMGLALLQDGDEDKSKLTLDSEILGSGANLSMGQQQIVVLAHVMVWGSKLLILDEDYKTDVVIQSSLRTELGSDVTLLTITHQLQTIMDTDKIWPESFGPWPSLPANFKKLLDLKILAGYAAKRLVPLFTEFLSFDNDMQNDLRLIYKVIIANKKGDVFSVKSLVIWKLMEAQSCLRESSSVVGCMGQRFVTQAAEVFNELAGSLFTEILNWPSDEHAAAESSAHKECHMFGGSAPEVL